MPIIYRFVETENIYIFLKQYAVLLGRQLCPFLLKNKIINNLFKKIFNNIVFMQIFIYTNCLKKVSIRR